jgi:hypothetical protein
MPTIAQLNDDYRRHRIFGAPHGRTVMTAGVAALEPAQLRRVFAAVVQFATFTPDNDPHHEHDFGAVDVDGERLFWKFDYYASAEMTEGAESGLDCYRVLTIMFAREY